MAGEIQYEESTRLAHKKLMDWLNGLFSVYVPGFWNPTIRNMIKESFVTTGKFFMQEMYSLGGETLQGFFVVSYLASASAYQIIYFDAEGNPLYYNNDDVTDIFDVDVSGKLSRFYTAVQLPMYDENDAHVMNLNCYYFTSFGIKFPRVELQTTIGAPVNRGYLDVAYSEKTGSTYTVVIQPLEEFDQYIVKNKSSQDIRVDIPLLVDYTRQYTIPGKKAVMVPKTPVSTQFLKEFSSTTEAISYKLDA